MASESRRKLTEDLIAGIRLPVAPPKGFNPLSADNETLIRHGLPLPPDKTLYGDHFAKWEQLMHHALTFISPEFDIIETAPDPYPSGNTQRGSEKEHGSKRWAGAVDINDSSDPYQRIEGSWIVPRAYPLTVDWTDWGWKNRSWSSATWVGIDGYHTHNSHVLQGGTAEGCIVSPRQTIEHPTHAWVEWIPALPIRLKNFEVNSGDLITCIVESPDPGSNLGAKSGRIMMFNRSTCNYSTAHLTMPKNGLPVEGKTAEWIVEGADSSRTHEDPVHQQSWSDHRHHTPYLGATFIYDCTVTTHSGKKQDLQNAKLVDETQFDQVLARQVVNTAVKENNSLLGVFSKATDPVWTKIDDVNTDRGSAPVRHPGGTKK